MLQAADQAPDPTVNAGRRTRGYLIDNREAVIGPLPEAAPPVVGAVAATDPESQGR